MAIDIRIRPVTVGDIDAINALYREEYVSYPYPLTPTSIRGGTQIVAECGEGKVRGFARAKPVLNHSGVVEFGGIIVDPTQRGNGVYRSLTRARLDAAYRQGIVAAISEPVCNRVDLASQRHLESAGFVPLGIGAMKYPGIRYEVLGQPETVTFAMRVLNGDGIFGRHRVYLPDDIASVIASTVPMGVLECNQSDALPFPMPRVRFHEALRVEDVIGSTFVDIPVNWPEAIEAIGWWRAGSGTDLSPKSG